MAILRMALIVILAICIGFAGGYYWEHQRVKDLEGKMKGLMVELENSSRTFRDQLVKSQVQKEIYKVKALIAEARSDIMERNFGRAEEKIAAIESSLDKTFSLLGERGIEVRDQMKMSLEGVKEGIKKLDVKVKAEIEELGKPLEALLEK
ncbi:MAG: hypothetical protein QHH30_01335 [candidate division NC10 bacterium]|nr:hypothetical protein [candidate division NC10 bacterium]